MIRLFRFLLVISFIWTVSAAFTWAQDDDRWRSDRRGSRDSRDESGPRQGGPKMGGGGGGGGVALAVEGKFVFVVSGGTLYKIDSESLKILGSVQLGSRSMGERRGGRPDSRRDEGEEDMERGERRRDSNEDERPRRRWDRDKDEDE